MKSSHSAQGQIGILSSTRHRRTHESKPGELLKKISGEPYVWIRPLTKGANDWVRLEEKNFTGALIELDDKLNPSDRAERKPVYLKFDLNFKMVGSKQMFFAENAQFIEPTIDELLLRLKKCYAATPSMSDGKNPSSMRIDGWTQAEAKRALQKGMMGREEYEMGKSENGLRGTLGPDAREHRDRESLVREILKRLDQKAQDKRALQKNLMGCEEYEICNSENGLRRSPRPDTRGYRDRKSRVRETLKSLDQKGQDK